MKSLPLFNTPAKRVTETSRESYRETLPSMQSKYRIVLAALASYIKWKEHEPTGKELMEFMAVKDANEVRPRLSDMKDPEKGLMFVQLSTFPRKCTVSGRNAHTWNLTPRGEAFLKGQK